MRASKWKGGKPEAALFPTPHLSWQQNSKFKTSALGWWPTHKDKGYNRTDAANQETKACKYRIFKKWTQGKEWKWQWYTLLTALWTGGRGDKGLFMQSFILTLIAQLVKNLPQCRRPWSDSWVGKIPWRRERLHTPVFWPGEFHGLHNPRGRKESDTTEWLSFHFTLMRRGPVDWESRAEKERYPGESGEAGADRDWS